MTIAQLEEKLTQNSASPLFARLADEYLAAGKVQEARALCISGLQQFTSYPTAYLVLARCCEAERDYQSALEAVSIALEHLPFTPLLHDLQVDLTGKLGLSALPLSQLTEDFPETLTSEVTEAGHIELPPEPSSIEAIEPQVQEDTAATSPEEIPIDDGMTAVTPLEDELRRSLEEHLHEVLDGEPVADAPAEPSEEITEPLAEITPANDILTGLEVAQIQTDEASETIQETPATTNDEASPSMNISETESTSPMHDGAVSTRKDPDEVEIKPAEIEQFFSERISELHVESLPEVEAPASEPPVEEPPPAAAVKPAYVPPPPVPEEADPLDETTSLGVDGRIVSRTLAEIYVMQGAIAEAILTYQLLKLEKPELRAECDARIRELEPKLQEKPSA